MTRGLLSNFPERRDHTARQKRDRWRWQTSLLDRRRIPRFPESLGIFLGGREGTFQTQSCPGTFLRCSLCNLSCGIPVLVGSCHNKSSQSLRNLE